MLVHEGKVALLQRYNFLCRLVARSSVYILHMPNMVNFPHDKLVKKLLESELAAVIHV